MITSATKIVKSECNRKKAFFSNETNPIASTIGKQEWGACDMHRTFS